MPNSTLNKKSKVTLSIPQKRAMAKILDLNTVRRKKEFVVEELKDADKTYPNSKTMNALVTKGFLKVRPSAVNSNVLYYQWSGLEPDKSDIKKLSDREKLNEIKQRYWNQKWDSLSIEDKLKDPLYDLYIGEITKFIMEFLILRQQNKLSKEFVNTVETAINYLDTLDFLNE